MLFKHMYITDLIYVCGGFDGTNRHASMERYDPTIDQWSLLGSMSIGREGAGLVMAYDMIYCIGGYVLHQSLNKCYYSLSP